MTIRRRRIVLGSAAVAAALTGLAVGISRGSGADSATEAQQISRVVKVYRRPWLSKCELDLCQIQIVSKTPITTPAAAERVDLVVRVGLGYRTSRGDRAAASMVLDTGTLPWPAMAPGSLPLVAAPDANTTTLTWVYRNLAAGGRRYALDLSVAPRRGRTGPEGATVSGAKTVLAADMTW